MDWKGLLLVALGGALGAVARFGVSTVLPRIVFPWHTLLVNWAGSFVLGAVFLQDGMEHSARLFFAVGFLGAFTTLSAYSVETIELWQEGRQTSSMANALLNAVGGPLWALAGWRLFA